MHDVKRAEIKPNFVKRSQSISRHYDNKNNASSIYASTMRYDSSRFSKYTSNSQTNLNEISFNDTYNPDFEKFLPIIKQRDVENVYKSYNGWKISNQNNHNNQYVNSNNPINNNQQNSNQQFDQKIFQYFPKIKPVVDDDKLKYDLSLFDTRIFKKIQFDEFQTQNDAMKLIKINKNNEYAFDVGNNLILRSLKVDDYDRDYLQLLKQFDDDNDDGFSDEDDDKISKEAFEEKFFKMKSCLNTYYILVIEDLTLNKIIATTTLINEHKFIRHSSARARIDDIAVEDTYRGKMLIKLLLDTAICIAKLLGCYNINIEGANYLNDFYEKFGFQLDNTSNIYKKSLM